MKKTYALLLALIHISHAVFAQDEAQGPDIDFIYGPATANIAGMAEIQVPAGFVFTGTEGTQTLMELYQNPITGIEVGFLAPEENGNWFMVFEFESIGYVNDDERDALDADAMLASMKAANKEGNKLRKERGWETIDLTGWAKKPFYNSATNNLEWATELVDEQGFKTVNYNTRLLGRKGVMAVTLVGDPVELAGIQDQYQGLLGQFAYTEGHRYAEWRSGDKIAQYGLTGLVVGGGAAIAAKSGFLAKFWKILIIPFIAVASLFKKITGGSK